MTFKERLKEASQKRNIALEDEQRRILMQSTYMNRVKAQEEGQRYLALEEFARDRIYPIFDQIQEAIGGGKGEKELIRGTRTERRVEKSFFGLRKRVTTWEIDIVTAIFSWDLRGNSDGASYSFSGKTLRVEMDGSTLTLLVRRADPSDPVNGQHAGLRAIFPLEDSRWEWHLENEIVRAVEEGACIWHDSGK